ncbi:MAG: hypothetical protein K940chlam4_01263 [Candidatus Anoxychlamydiales bacterium]|nr:hypothetical protein [Candidatus Anoxychlamydiales bacterium]
MYKYYSERVYEITDHNFSDYNSALNKIREWNYNDDGKEEDLTYFEIVLLGDWNKVAELTKKFSLWR